MKTPMNKKPGQSIRSVRTPHGTRVMRSITCTRCGKSDTLSFVPKDNHGMFCKDCAALDLQVLEESPIRKDEKLIRCMDCGQGTVVGKLELAEAKGKLRCQACDLKQRDLRRKSARRPGGVHPVVVKKTKPQE